MSDRLLGKLESCIGASCPKSCCLAEKFQSPSGSTIMMNTWYRDEAEIANNTSGLHELTKLGVKITPVEVLYEGVKSEVMAVCNCNDASGCKIPRDERPDVCNSHPFNLVDPENPISTDCPRFLEIYAEAREKGILKEIFGLRKKIGFGDNKLWSKNLKRLAG